MRSLQISFFDCCKDRPSWITVNETGQTAYTYMERVARALKHWITITTKRLYRTMVRSAHAYVRHVFCNTGAQILRRSAILRL